MKFLLLTFILLSFFFSNPCLSKHNNKEFIKQASASNTLIKFYQKYLSPINQSTCQSYPSCSRYAMQAIEKHRFLGFLMTADRLNRCGHDIHLYERIIIDNSIKNYDPVE